MSITDNASLTTAIASWLKRDDLTSNIPDFIQMYEVQMNRELVNMNPPHYCLNQNQTGALSVTGSSPYQIALPTGYRGTKRLQILDSGQYRTLTYKTPAEMAKYQTGSSPRYYTIIGTNIEIASTPGVSVNYNWDYQAPLTSITAGSNWMIANSPDMYLYGSLLHSAPFLKADARLATWGNLYAKCLADLELNNSRYHYSGSTLQQRSDSAV